MREDFLPVIQLALARWRCSLQQAMKHFKPHVKIPDHKNTFQKQATTSLRHCALLTASLRDHGLLSTTFLKNPKPWAEKMPKDFRLRFCPKIAPELTIRLTTSRSHKRGAICDLSHTDTRRSAESLRQRLSLMHAFATLKFGGNSGEIT